MVVERRRVGVVGHAERMNVFIELVCGDTWLDLVSSLIKDVSAELKRKLDLDVKKE